ncbi:hypothetical protein ACFX2I_000751 [Malus domestica]
MMKTSRKFDQTKSHLLHKVNSCITFQMVQVGRRGPWSPEVSQDVGLYEFVRKNDVAILYGHCSESRKIRR